MKVCCGETKAAGWSLMKGVANLAKGDYNMSKDLNLRLLILGAVR
jgi:hypothetical protein